MAKRSRPISSRKPARKQASRVAKGLTILRRKKLIGKDEFKNPLSGSARKIVRKYAGVIEGRDTVVTPKTRLIPKRLRKALKERHGRLVVPKVEGTVSTVVKRIPAKGRGKKREAAYTTIERTVRKRSGELERQTVETPTIEISGLPKGKVYKVSGRNWGRGFLRQFANKKSLDEFLAFYDNGQEWLDISIGNLTRGFKDDYEAPWFRVLYWKNDRKHRVTFQAPDRAMAVTLFEDVYGDYPIISVTAL